MNRTQTTPPEHLRDLLQQHGRTLNALRMRFPHFEAEDFALLAETHMLGEGAMVKPSTVGKTSLPPRTAQKAKALPPTKKPAKKSTSVSAAREGRREVALGLRPSTPEAIARVMGKSAMSAKEVLLLLTAKKWLPKAKDCLTYVGHVMSTHHNIFSHAGQSRGVYVVKEPEKYAGEWKPKV